MSGRLTIGDTIPDLELDTTHGRIRIHDYVGNGYAIVFSHPGTVNFSIIADIIVCCWCRNTLHCRYYLVMCFPDRIMICNTDAGINYDLDLFIISADFTPVCTTEMAAMASYAGEFEKRGVKLLGISCDDVSSHKEWIKDVEAYKVSTSYI